MPTKSTSEWVACLDKRPTERTGEDLDIIYSRLKSLHIFEKFHPMLLQQICYYSYYEDLEDGVILFRQGDLGTNWYAVLSGSLDVHFSSTGETKDSVTLCTLGVGTAFGESILDDQPRHATVVTNEYCELLRIEQKDFRVLWERNKQFLQGSLCPFGGISILDSSRCLPIQFSPILTKSNRMDVKDEMLSSAVSVIPIPCEQLASIGHVIHNELLIHAPHMIRDRKYHLRLYRRCMVATEMVDWMVEQGVRSRYQAVGMWQALLEEGVILHVCREHQFKDKYLFYRFRDDEQESAVLPLAEKKQCDDELQQALQILSQIGPDAMMRMILRKTSAERSVEELEIIYEELLHIKALSHLSTMVKHELASVLMFEAHVSAGTILFNQGDEGNSWYIILKGSVNVVINGKGVVCTLHEGDDFGKLALVNDAPRAATIILREDNCHFLKVDKDDFNRILRDVEANTVRLKEHGIDVLVLEKIPVSVQLDDGSIQAHYKYSVMAGTPEKMLEHLLETAMNKPNDSSDTFIEDFLLTHVIFMPDNHLCPTLMAHYHAGVSLSESQCIKEKSSGDYALTNKRRVVQFVQQWYHIVGDAFLENKTINGFLEELHSALDEDCRVFEQLKVELDILTDIIEKKNQHLAADDCKNIDSSKSRKPFKGHTNTIFKVYCADHTYTTLKLPMEASVSRIVRYCAHKLGLGNDLVLCEVRSNGERVTFKEDDLAITAGLSVNGRLFVSPREHLDALTPLAEQEGPAVGSGSVLELMSSKEVAYELTLHDWELFSCVHEYELIYMVFGRALFGKVTANLDAFLRHFNEVQFWVVSELCLTHSLSRRVQLLRKFIKIASHCREYKNLNSFFAIVMGLSNIAVSRLSQTWEKLPNKLKKLFAEYEMALDPSRNHRVYRLAFTKMEPPIIPFMPLLMKDMTFTHEGNKTHFEGNLVNFEKMHMLAQTLRTVKHCRSQSLQVPPPAEMKSVPDIRNYIRNLKVIDNQRVLTQLSHKLEPRRP